MRLSQQQTVSTVALSDKNPSTTESQRLWRQFGRDRTAVLGALVLLLIVLSVVVGPFFYAVSYSELRLDQSMASPSWTHPLGTNNLGQDQLARILWGGRVSLAVGVAAMLMSISVGTVVGMVSGFCGGLVDNALMRLTDLFLSLPRLPLLLLILYLFRDPARRLADRKSVV